MKRLSRAQRRDQFVKASVAVAAVLDCLHDDVRELLIGRIRDHGAVLMRDLIAEWLDYCARAGELDEAAKAEVGNVPAAAEGRK